MAFDVRALEYAACTWALQQDSRVPGSEATFEQALTNALAAILSRDFPDELRGDRGIKSATQLLDVLGAKAAPGESPGVVRLPHDPRAGITWTTFDGIPGLDDPYPNFTTLYVDQLRLAIRRTQAVRHARASEPGEGLHSDDLAALEALVIVGHPALFVLDDEARDRLELATIRADA